MFTYILTLSIINLAKFTSAKLETEPVVELRWDFSDCNNVGREGPTQEQCTEAYVDTNLEGDVIVLNGIQQWTAPLSGLYLITAQGPSGLRTSQVENGFGAAVSSEFRMEVGEKLNILVGQQSDYKPAPGSSRGPGGSGGTFVTRVTDDFLLLVGGGGSAGSGRTPASLRNHANAALSSAGKSGSAIPGNFDSTQGSGGVDGQGGNSGILSRGIVSTGGGGAGYLTDGGISYIRPGELLQVRGPRPALGFNSSSFSEDVPGSGGFFQLIENGLPKLNNGGFGGGGSGCSDGGAGGGGGYSGGGGGPLNGWGGGGGSINNGEMQKSPYLNDGKGAVVISFIGYACCGPIAVYVAVCFISGIIFTILAGFGLYHLMKFVKKCRKGDAGLFTKNSGSYSISREERRELEPAKREKPPKTTKNFGQYTPDDLPRRRS